jgi:hypothetical protein
VQGQSASEAWKEVERLANKWRIAVTVEFSLRQNPKAQHPVGLVCCAWEIRRSHDGAYAGVSGELVDLLDEAVNSLTFAPWPTWFLGFRRLAEQSEWRRRRLLRLWAEGPSGVPLRTAHLG